MSVASSFFFFFFISPLSLQSTRKDMEAFLVPDKWIRVRPNSHRDSAKTDDRPLEPHSWFLYILSRCGGKRQIVEEGKGKKKKHLTFIPLFLLNFLSFRGKRDLRDDESP